MSSGFMQSVMQLVAIAGLPGASAIPEEVNPPPAVVAVDGKAMDLAIEQARCVLDANRALRSASGNSASFEDTSAQVAQICDLAESQNAIIARLRQAYPTSSEEDILEKHKELALLSAVHVMREKRQDDAAARTGDRND